MDDSERVDDGIFFVEQGQLSIGSLTLSIDDEGNVKSEPVQIKMRFDVCPVWIDIALSQLIIAKGAAKEIQIARKEKNEEKMGEALRKEMHAGMQAIVAGCVAMEAFHASVIRHCDLPKDLTDSWKRKKTAKYKKITEVLKIAYYFKPENVAAVRKAFKECFELRDKAVHPSQEYEFPAVHPELNKRVDLKFVLFRFINAKNLTEIMLSVLYQSRIQLRSAPPAIRLPDVILRTRQPVV